MKPNFGFTYYLSGAKMIKFQQSQVLTSHFESFWSIVLVLFCKIVCIQKAYSSMAKVLVHTTIRVHYGLNFLHLTGFYQDTTFRPLAFMSFRQSSLLMPSNGPKLSASNNTNPTNRSFCLSELRTKWPNTAIPRNGENHDLKHSFLEQYLMITFCYRIGHCIFSWVDLFFLINCLPSSNCREWLLQCSL